MNTATANIHPVTGIRYGAISGHSLRPSIMGQLLDLATEASEAAHWNERANDLRRTLTSIAPGALPEHIDSIINDQLIDEQADYHDDEPCADVELHGVKCHVTYLGGAMLVLVTESPYTTYRSSLCSPCCPNAVNLDSEGCDPGEGHHGYTVPAAWLAVDGED